MVECVYGLWVFPRQCECLSKIDVADGVLRVEQGNLREMIDGLGQAALVNADFTELGVGEPRPGIMRRVFSQIDSGER